MRKELNKSRYILAAILTLIILASGIGIGLVIEKARLLASERSNVMQDIALNSLQVQQLYLDAYNINSCESIQKLLESNMNDLDLSMKRLVKYSKSAVINKEDFELNLRDYFITELQYFLISEKMKSKCKMDSVNVLYFYIQTEESDRQGYVLDFIKKKFGDQVMIFSFNANFESEPMIEMLTKAHDLEEFPAIAINSKTFEGYTPEEGVERAVCEALNNKSPYCLWGED